MTYFNYHAKAKFLIRTNHLIGASIFSNYHSIKPALVLYFDVNRPMPIRDYMWKDYFEILKDKSISIQNPDHINIKEYL